MVNVNLRASGDIVYNSNWMKRLMYHSITNRIFSPHVLAKCSAETFTHRKVRAVLTS